MPQVAEAQVINGQPDARAGECGAYGLRVERENAVPAGHTRLSINNVPGITQKGE